MKVNVAYIVIQVSWLLTLSGRPFQPPQQYDDPNLTCTNILSELREAGFAPASFPPTKLRQGHGDAVCSILNALCDLTLELTNFSFQAPVYLAETYALVSLPVSCLKQHKALLITQKACMRCLVADEMMYGVNVHIALVFCGLGVTLNRKGSKFSSVPDVGLHLKSCC